MEVVRTQEVRDIDLPETLCEGHGIITFRYSHMKSTGLRLWLLLRTAFACVPLLKFLEPPIAFPLSEKSGSEVELPRSLGELLGGPGPAQKIQGLLSQ